jgi:glycine amidinotransferase
MRVQSNNEWDPLEEVIVGILDGAANLTWEIGFEAIAAKEHLERSRKFHLQAAGQAVSPLNIAKAKKELNYFVEVLEKEGVKVRRPEVIHHTSPITTPQWTSMGGNCQANPRDVLIVFDDEILEAPMAWRSRYFEFWAYRKLVKEYFKEGARWTAAPKPELSNASYDYNWAPGEGYVTNEYEPVFDAADISRCGKDLFIQRSHVTNDMGIEWLRRHLEPRGYRIHRVEFDDYRAIHIDATFVPLAPGKILINPDRPIKELPSILKNSDWELREAPRSTLPKDHPWYYSFKWLSMNVLNIDEKRVITEADEGPMHEFLSDWGFEPIPVPFRNNYSFGGSFHCATVDIKRRGKLQDYFS